MAIRVRGPWTRPSLFPSLSVVRWARRTRRPRSVGSCLWRRSRFDPRRANRSPHPPDENGLSWACRSAVHRSPQRSGRPGRGARVIPQGDQAEASGGSSAGGAGLEGGCAQRVGWRNGAVVGLPVDDRGGGDIGDGCDSNCRAADQGRASPMLEVRPWIISSNEASDSSAATTRRNISRSARPAPRQSTQSGSAGRLVGRRSPSGPGASSKRKAGGRHSASAGRLRAAACGSPATTIARIFADLPRRQKSRISFSTHSLTAAAGLQTTNRYSAPRQARPDPRGQILARHQFVLVAKHRLQRTRIAANTRRDDPERVGKDVSLQLHRSCFATSHPTDCSRRTLDS